MQSIELLRFRVKLAVDIEAKQKYAIKIMKTDPTTD